MNIRAKIFGGGVAAEEPLLKGKKPKGAKPDALDSVTVPRETRRLNNSRGKDRHRLSNETARVTHDGGEFEVALINVSGGGAMISKDIEAKLWDKVELQLGTNDKIEATVRWVGQDRLGLQFAHETRLEGPQDQVAAILRSVIERTFPDIEFASEEEADVSLPEPQVRQSADEHRAARRHPLIWTGVLHHDFQSSRVRIRNISATGAMIQTDAMVRVGSEPLLELGEDVSLSATVGWAAGDQVGLKFHSPFDIGVLSRSQPAKAGGNWKPPRFLDLRGEPGASEDRFDRLTVVELRDELESFLKR